MASRDEVQLDDPVAKYLPVSVKVPTHAGKSITLVHLATHTAGFPVNPNNMTGRNDRERYETYTVEKMYSFLSSYQLSRDPGAEFEYSNIGMALLGHALERRWPFITKRPHRADLSSTWHGEHADSTDTRGNASPGDGT